MKGNFTPHDFAEVLRDALITERSGVLWLHRAGAWKSLWFSQGMVAAASSSRDEENLAALLDSGPAREEAARQPAEVSADPCALGRLFLEREYADEPALQAVMQRTARDILASLFKWETGEYEFEEKEIDPTPFVPDVLCTVEFILHGVQGISDFQKIRNILLGVDSALKWNEAQYLPVESLAFGPLEGFVISRIDGNTSVEQICTLSPPSEEERTCRFLYGLLVLGVVGWEPSVNGERFRFHSLAGTVLEGRRQEGEEDEQIATFYEKVSKSSLFEILGIRDTDPLEKGKEASSRLREKFRPENFSERVRVRRREELEIIDAKILEAFLAFQAVKASRARKGTHQGGEAPRIQEADQRREMVKTETQAAQEQKEHLAQQFYRRARESQVMGDFHAAIDHCQNAIRNNPGIASYYALLASCQLKNPDHRWQKRAEDNLLKAIELDPWKPDHFLSLGKFYLNHGMKAKAKRHLEKALEIQPNHPEALEAMKRLR